MNLISDQITNLETGAEVIVGGPPASLNKYRSTLKGAGLTKTGRRWSGSWDPGNVSALELSNGVKYDSLTVRRKGTAGRTDMSYIETDGGMVDEV